MSNHAIRLLSAGTAVLAAAFALPGAASAQLFFDWGGGSEKVNDSGRQPVRINVDAKPGEIIVSFTDRKLYLMTGPGQAISYPVAIPREQDRWEGKTTVTQKRENPSWTPTPTMIKENPRLPRWVPGGHPMNPLGNRALYLGSSFYRIHGTDAPWTIGTAVSKGCIRMYNKDALDVYERTKVGARVLVTWNKYDTKPEGEPGQTAAAAQEDTPAGRRAAAQSGDRAADRAGPAPAAAAAAAVVPAAATAASAPAAPGASTPVSSSERKVAQSGSRYSDIFGTPEPPAPVTPAGRTPAQPQSAAPAQSQPRPARPVAERDAQVPREQRRARETNPEGNAAAATEAPAAQPAAPRQRQTEPKAAAEPKAKAAPVETGSLSERNRPRPKSAPEQPAVAATPQVDAATKALEAAERAAAAAERAAAAAERAERALAARAAIVAPVAAPALVEAPVQAAAPTAAPAPTTAREGGGD